MMRYNNFDITYTEYAIKGYGLCCELYKSSKPVLVVAPQYGKHIERLYKADLANLPVIYTNIIWENFISDNSGLTLSSQGVFKIRSNMWYVAKAFCLAGQGYSFLPHDYVTEELASGKLIEIPVCDLKVSDIPIYLVYNKKRRGSQALSRWMSCIKVD
jgi:DNA-binding transcriptional LysR family regulator